MPPKKFAHNLPLFPAPASSVPSGEPSGDLSHLDTSTSGDLSFSRLAFFLSLPFSAPLSLDLSRPLSFDLERSRFLSLDLERSRLLSLDFDLSRPLSLDLDLLLALKKCCIESLMYKIQ